MTRRRSGRALALAATGALAMAGCGNSDDPGDTTAAPATAAAGRPALTKAQFIRATADICRRTDRDISAFIPLGTDPATRHANRQGVIAVIRRQNEAIHALGYPPGASRADLDGVHRDVAAALARAARDDTLDIEQEIGRALEPYADTLGEFTPDCQ